MKTVETSQEKDRKIVEYFELREPERHWLLHNLDLTSETGFFLLWGWMRKRETWEAFIYWLDQKGQIHPDDISPIILFIDSRTLFRDTVFEFLKEKGE